ncbi:MAG: ABC transporter ATP-binding protein [Anaerolineales bacterium]|nr:ABC transporter ATP-binding protein [Anaerolineales bacterium]
MSMQPDETPIAVACRGVTKIYPAGRQSARVVAVDNLDLEIRHGEFFTLLGPSGCGKTTTLRMIAGFEQPTSGEIFIDGQPMSQVGPEKRPVNTVFQNYALFPHLNVGDNVGFGLKVKRVPAAERARRVTEALALVRLPGLEGRRATQLSGGQQQRVALARALVNEPAVLLLDEPLGALDLKLRKAVQLELKQLQHELGITFIYVTHDQEEAITMSDRIAVMSDGLVQQIGSPREIYEHPTNRFVADFIGETNFIVGEIKAAGRTSVIESKGVHMAGQSRHEFPVGKQVTLAVRPEKIHLHAGQETRQETGKVFVPGIITEMIYIGTDTRYRVDIPTGDHLFVRLQNLDSAAKEPFATGDGVLVEWAEHNAQILAD